MDAWERWYQMAQGSLAAAVLLKTQGEARSSASRAYYAAYQAVTAVLLYQGMMPPEGREAWSHEATPELFWKLSGTVLTQDARRDASSRLEASYALRVHADYVSIAELTELALRGSIKDASFILKLAKRVFE